MLYNQDGDVGERKTLYVQVHKGSCPRTGRAKELFDVLSLEQGALTDSQTSSFKELIADHADVFVHWTIQNLALMSWFSTMRTLERAHQ